MKILRTSWFEEKFFFFAVLFKSPALGQREHTVGATSERTAAGKTEKLIFRAFFSSKM